MTDKPRLSILPANRSRLEAGLDLVFADLLERIAPPFPELMNAQETPEAFLPYLAADRGVSEWSAEAPEQEKRETAAKAWSIKRRAGTKAALLQAVTSLQLVPEVLAWYELTPAGTPYSFRVRAWSDQGYSEELDRRLTQRLGDAKSERDTISVSIGMSVSGTHYIGGCMVLAELGAIYPYKLEGLEQQATFYLAAGLDTVEKTTLYPNGAAT